MSMSEGAQKDRPVPGPGSEAQKGPCLVVAIGASSGGQEALEQIFTTLPTDCNVAFAVLMHLPPDGPSFLAEMLGRYTSMPVVTAEEGMPFRANRVHVIPAGRTLEVKGGVLHLGGIGVLPAVHHTIDLFFSSLGTELGAGAVAVVLSGSGSDGSRGVKTVKECGGVVIVQDPRGALSPSMPASAIATGTADFVLPAEEIPQRIAELAHGTCVLSRHACSVVSLEEELHAIFALVKARTGHDFSSYKRNTVVRRIERRMAVNDSASMKKYLALLEQSPQEAQALGQEILIGVTSFFRDPDAFEVLRREIIPQLFAGRDPDDPVRIWHACCATGEEVYSTAILIREYLSRRGMSAKVQLFATDIDEVAIAQARSGLYGSEIEADLGPDRLAAFFHRVNGHWQVAKELRQMVVFAHHNLIKDAPFSRLDLLVCRNFLIYLNPDMQKRLMSLFHMVLKPSGFLFLGSAETVGHHSDLFAPLDKKWKLYERLDSLRREETGFPFTAAVRRFPGAVRQAQPLAPDPLSPAALAEKFLAERYLPPYVIVNEKYEVLHVAARADRFLAVPVGEPTRDLLKMAREELRPALRAAIYKAFLEQKPVSFRGVRLALEQLECAVNLTVHPLTTADKLALAVLEPAPVQVAAPCCETEPPAGEPGGRDLLVRQLEEQLRVTHEQLLATSEQLETSQEGFVSANEELMSINEEFQSANEELQSTNEELETSKEELQALNEELSTTNAELQCKLEELDQANSDMENLLASSDNATLFLDRNLIIKRFTPAIGEILNLIGADVGRPFRHLAGTIDWSGLPADAAQVMERLAPVEREVSGVENGRSYLMRVLPYKNAGRVDGVVVTLVDITERKLSEEVILRAKEQWERTFDSVPDLIAIMDERHRIVRANRALAQRLGVTPQECVGQPCYLAVHHAEHPPESCPHSQTIKDGREHVAEVREERLGGDFLVSTSPLLDKHGSLLGSVHVARDITERKRAEELRARLAAIVEFSDDAIITKDLSGTIETWNAAAQRLFGYTAEEAIGRPVCILLPERLREEEESILGRLWAGERIQHYDTVRLTADGREIEVSVSISPVKNATGDIIGASKIARDISVRRRSEEETKRLVAVQQELLAEVRDRMHELERFNRASVGRELRMVELKREINELCLSAGLPRRYRVDFEEEC